MIILPVTNLRHSFMEQRISKNTHNTDYSHNLQNDVFIKSSPSFQGNLAQKTAKTVSKNKKGIWLAIASLLGIATTTVNSTEKTQVKEPTTITVEEKRPMPRYTEYSLAELDGIMAWERANNEHFIELREILKHKENHSPEDFLTKDEVISLADYLKEKTKILSTYLKTHPNCSPRELMKLRELDKTAPKYYSEVAKYCPYANADEYEKIAKNFSSLWMRERQAVANFSRQRELIQKMEQIQKKNPNDYMLEIYFSEYRLTLPPEDRAKLKGISIKTAKINELPTMTVDDLVKRLEFLKTPEGKTEHLI